MRARSFLVVGALILVGCSGDSEPDAVDARPSGASQESAGADDDGAVDDADADADAADDADGDDGSGVDDGGSAVGDAGDQDSDGVDGGGSDDEASVPAAAWERCDDVLTLPGLPVLECATIDVPLDYDDSDGDTIPIALARQEAADPSARIGSIVFNPGGPGGSGIEYLETGRLLIPAEVAAVFDLVAFDPRGVGASASVHCDLTRDDGVVLVADDDRPTWDAALETGQTELATCTSDPAGIEAYVGTNNAARDLDRIRASVGDDLLTYVGFSYGTRLGATYAELFPDKVRALVLDGGVLPSTDPAARGRQQADGFDLAFGNFADACDTDPDCVVGQHGTTRDVLDRIRADIAQAGEFPTDDPTRVLTPGELDLGVLASLYSQTTWTYLSFAMDEAAARGDGTIFQVLADLYMGRELDGTYSNLVEANGFINCADDPARPPEEEVWEEADLTADASDYFADYLRASFGCLGFPEPVDPLTLGPAEGAPPILVIGTTGDPATPFDWSQQLADSLASGILYSVEGEGHTAYTSIECVTPVVNAYLIDLEVPEPGDGCVDDSDIDPFPPEGESEAELVIEFFECLMENGADVEPIGIADVLRDPSGEQLLGGLDLDDPALLGALLPCQEFLLG
jgi:pimeloyl-ACP methyl ester carboxylesterase